MPGRQWSELENLDDVELEALMYPNPKSGGRKEQPDWQYVHRENRRPGLTLELLWHEYVEKSTNPYSYSQFTHLYGDWRKCLNIVMRQDHIAGEKLFVDWSGKTKEVIDPETGVVEQEQIFVAVMGVSNYCYAEATLSQDLKARVGAHVRAFEYMGAVPRRCARQYQIWCHKGRHL